MSAEEYQRAFGDLLRSPELCRQLRRHAPNGEPGRDAVSQDDPGSRDSDPLEGYHLTTRERARLHAVSRHRGMVVNCTLYRASRLVGITRRLPRTVDALGATLRQVFDAYVAAQPDAEPEFDREALRFAAFITALPALDLPALNLPTLNLPALNLPALDPAVRDILAAETAALPAAPSGTGGEAPGGVSGPG